MSNRVMVLWAVLVLGVAAGAGSASASASAGRCDHVRGRVLLDTSSARVVSRPVHGGRRFFGCAKPSGAPRRLGDRIKVPGDTETFHLQASAGLYVLVKRTFDSGPAGTLDDDRDVIDLATGEDRTIYGASYAEGECPGIGGRPAPPGDPRRIVLGANGIAVGVFVGGGATFDPECTQQGTWVIAYVPHRPAFVLDHADVGTIAPASLALASHIAYWTSSGTARSAML